MPLNFHSKLPVNKPPEPSDWDFITLIEEFQSEEEMSEFLSGRIKESNGELRQPIFAASDTQKVVTKKGEDPKPAIVEFTRGFIDLEYDEFVRRLNPCQWGKSLANYEGGDTAPYDGEVKNANETWQIERMVLGLFDFGVFRPVIEGLAAVFPPVNKLIKSDMTKTEIIISAANDSKVHWRVYHSDDDSVIDDIGSVEFRSHDGGTLVTFHSAHVLKIGENIGPKTLGHMVSHYFKESIRNYDETVRSVKTLG